MEGGCNLSGLHSPDTLKVTLGDYLACSTCSGLILCFCLLADQVKCVSHTQATHQEITEWKSKGAQAPPATVPILPPGLRGGTGLSASPSLEMCQGVGSWTLSPKNCQLESFQKTSVHSSSLSSSSLYARILTGCPRSLCLDTAEWINNTLNQVKSMHHLAQGHVHFKEWKTFKQWLWMGIVLNRRVLFDVNLSFRLCINSFRHVKGSQF